jgi:hypothetical protein
MKELKFILYNESDGELNGMSEITNKDIIYSNIRTHHGMQCEDEGDNPEYQRKFKLLAKIDGLARELFKPIIVFENGSQIIPLEYKGETIKSKGFHLTIE